MVAQAQVWALRLQQAIPLRTNDRPIASPEFTTG
jgi:hypothetical protein